MKHVTISSVLALAVLAVACSEQGLPISPSAVSPANGLAAKPPKSDSLSPASAVFLDRPGDAITSDGGGPYVNSQGGFESAFHSISQDFVLRGSEGSRYLNLDYTNRLSGSGPVGTEQVSKPFFRISRILDMAVGERRFTGATAGDLGGGPTPTFQFNPNEYADSTFVQVDRMDACTWVVTADGAVSATVTGKGRQQSVSTYAMPFAVTITLDNCTGAN